MAIKHYITRGWTDGARSLAFQETVAPADPGEINGDPTIAHGGSPIEVSCVFAYAKLASVYLYSATAMTLKTNSSSSPADTISIPAGIPVVWTSGSGLACPFAHDVTKFYLVNSAGADDVFQYRLLLDNTP